MSYLSVALGGAIGSGYAISLIPVKSQFPILILITNFFGTILIGFIVGLTERKNFSKDSILFWKTGICGGFTTFSTFSLEAYNLFKSKMYGFCSAYVLLSVTGCFLGVWWGKKLATNML